jgi:hypothetical protein
MADFKTHLLGATLVSGVLATGVAMTGVASQSQVVGYFTLGVAGGLMPDIDSESSIPIRIAYQVISLLAALMLVFAFADIYSFVELLILGLAGYAFVRYVVFSLFLRLTVHRGLVHSIPGAAICAMLTIILAVHFFDSGNLHAWLCGVFMFIGFIVHLVMDEMYSVDLLGRRLKKSFGSALTFGDGRNIPGTTALYAAMFALFTITPPPAEFIRTFFYNPMTYYRIFDHLVPDGPWFSGLFF